MALQTGDSFRLTTVSAEKHLAYLISSHSGVARPVRVREQRTAGKAGKLAAAHRRREERLQGHLTLCRCGGFLRALKKAIAVGAPRRTRQKRRGSETAPCHSR